MKKKFLIDMVKRFKKVPAALGINQNEMAKEAGVNASYLSDLINGKKTNPGIGVLYEIARKYRLSLDYLLLGEGEMFLPSKAREVFDVKSFKYKVETAEEINWVLKHSIFVKSSVVNFLSRLFIEEEEIIKKDLEKYELYTAAEKEEPGNAEE